jgi:MtrB/PioB family decaheme-associated outer membrane protein
MKSKLLLIALLGLLLAPCAYGEDDNPFSGGVFLGGRALNLDHQSANFNQYNGIVPGLFGGGDLGYGTDKYHFDVDAAYLGEDDMAVKLNGGMWGSFKFSLFYTEFPHNYSFEDRTIYTDPGSQNLTLPGRASATPTNSALWPSTSFDYSIERKDVGGSVDVTAIAPFFFNVTADRLQREGDMPWSGHSAFGFSNTVELPLPIDDHTTNANGLFGWKNKQFYAALGVNFSEYGDNAEFTRFQDAFTTGATQAFGTIVGPPDNKSWGVSFTGNAKQLPFNSVFALNASYQENTSSTSLLNTIEAGTFAAPTVQTLRLSESTFNGDVKYMSVGASLTSNPVKDLTTKLYFKDFDRKNDSDQVTFANPTTAATLADGTIMNTLFDYNKTSAGADLTYRFLQNLKGIASYDFTDTRREGGEDFLTSPTPTALGIDNVPRTVDNTFKGGLVYNPLDWLGGRLMYQHLDRGTNTELQPGTANLTANNVTRFDIGNQNQDMAKLTADLTPLEGLDVSLEYAYKRDKYNDAVLGFQNVEENEFVLDGNYVWKGIKFFAFFDYDAAYTDQIGRSENHSSPVTDPNAPPTTSNFNWNAYMRNNNFAFGVGTSIPIIKDKLAFKLQWDSEKNDGYADFTSQIYQTSAGINNSTIDIAPWDDYTRQNISAMVTYAYDKHLSFNFGFLYSQFKLNDGQLNGYQYVAPGPTYLTGAYTDQSYKANIYYVRACYRF